MIEDILKRTEDAHDIFRQEFMSIYEKKNQYREQVKEQAEESLLFLLEQMKMGTRDRERMLK